jgi:hypothetical protein
MAEDTDGAHPTDRAITSADAEYTVPDNYVDFHVPRPDDVTDISGTST